MLKDKQNFEKLLINFGIYVLFFILFSPIYLNLDFSQGINFDQVSNIKYSKPSVSISIFLLVLLSAFNLKCLTNKKEIRILLILTTSYLLLNIYHGMIRAVILYVGMFLPVISYYIFYNIFYNKSEVYYKMYKTLAIIIILMCIMNFQMAYFDFLECRKNSNSCFDTNFFIFLTNYFDKSRYLLDSIVIYSYHDYFPFIYYLVVVTSIHNIICKKIVKLSLLLIIITNVLILYSGSRLFVYSIYLIPILIVIYYVAKLKLKTYFYLFMSTSVIITLIIGLIDFTITEQSLLSRYVHAHAYFEDFSFFSFLLPFLNEHRIESKGSFHNELLELFSFFGLVIIYYYYIIRNIFVNVKSEYKLISYLLMFIIVIGSLIQLNITNVYVGIILGMVLAVISVEDSKVITTKINQNKEVQ